MDDSVDYSHLKSFDTEMINRSDGALMKKKKMIAREKEGDSDGK